MIKLNELICLVTYFAVSDNETPTDDNIFLFNDLLSKVKDLTPEPALSQLKCGEFNSDQLRSGQLNSGKFMWGQFM